MTIPTEFFWRLIKTNIHWERIPDWFLRLEVEFYTKFRSLRLSTRLVILTISLLGILVSLPPSNFRPVRQPTLPPFICSRVDYRSCKSHTLFGRQLLSTRYPLLLKVLRTLTLRRNLSDLSLTQTLDWSLNIPLFVFMCGFVTCAESRFNRRRRKGGQRSGTVPWTPYPFPLLVRQKIIRSRWVSFIPG